ncbi:MAG TPA: CAP domain-containing protein [Solirubrobacteraceae bacterium]|nr:CAP domain-containing protein [Solirubrobacteraceae bacterium]
MAFVAVIMLVAAIGGPQRLRAYAQGDGGCGASTRIPMPDALEQARTATLCLINRERAAHGLPALATDGRLTWAAQLHADDMGRRNFYDHRNPDGAVPSARVYAQACPRTARPSRRTSTGARGGSGHRGRSCATG